jgi:5-methylcytosine-specific restriction protein A
MRTFNNLSSLPFGTETVGEEEIRREKERARKLRRTHWWNKKIQTGICHYCHNKVGRKQLTMDHVVPLSRGGKSNKGNIVPACKDCNNKKKYLLPIEWEEYLKSLAECALDS